MFFVTGGTGLVGSHLVAELLERGEAVRILRRKTSNTDALKRLLKRRKLDHHWNQLEWIEGELTDVAVLSDGMQGVDYVCHCAAIVSFDPRDKQAMEHTNLEGTASVVNVALQEGIKKLIYVSSTAAIGKQKPGITIDESHLWEAGNKNSFYSYTKHAAELEVWRGAEEGLSVAIVNPSVIIGPGEWGKSSTSLIATLANGLKFYTRGGNAFVDVRDVARAMVKLALGDHSNRRYLLVSENLKFKELFDLICQELSVKKVPYLASSWMSSIAWRLSFIWSKISGRRPVITKETARSANEVQCYSNERALTELEMNFIPISASVKETCSIYLQEQGN